MSICFTYITSRRDCRIEWWFESLARIISLPAQVIVVDAYAEEPGRRDEVLEKFAKGFVGPLHIEHVEKGNVPGKFFSHVLPKPTIWQGKHRITKEDWWAKSSGQNTSVCLCREPWICMTDDRSVLMPGYFECLVDAMRSGYAVVGTYEKHANMKVENGVIVDPGETLGVDHRPQFDHPTPTHDWYGGHFALPLEWCLQVNGWSEDVCDSLGLEDAMFGVTLRNSGLPMCYDARMKIIEDRTPGEIDGALKRADKGVSPNDKSHKIVEIFRDKNSSQNSFDIRNLRDRVLNGEPFPAPSASHLDWYDGQPISEMT